MIKIPKATVLMPVYNGAKHLNASIESVLNQSFTNFEFLIIDDGSTDNSIEITQSYNDERIRLVKNDTNLQIVKSLNRGIQLAKGDYIIRMDSDDICLANRFERQINFMEDNPEIDVCGSWVETFFNKKRVWKTPEKDKDIKAYLFFNSAIIHPSVIVRKKSLTKYKLNYRQEYNKSEDYDLWEISSNFLKFANIPEILLKYRLEIKTNQLEYKKIQKANTNNIRNRQLSKLIPDLLDIDLQIHEKLTSIQSNYLKDDILELNKWIKNLITANKKINKYDNIAFIRLLAQRFYTICNLSTHLGLWIWKQYYLFEYKKHIRISFIEEIKFLIKCIIKKRY